MVPQNADEQKDIEGLINVIRFVVTDNTDSGAFVFLPDSKSSALVFTPEPGIYTVVLEDKDEAGEVALIEVYKVPTKVDEGE